MVKRSDRQNEKMSEVHRNTHTHTHTHKLLLGTQTQCIGAADANKCTVKSNSVMTDLHRSSALGVV